MFLLKKNKSLFASVSKGVSQEVSLKKGKKWLTQKQVDAKWTEKEVEVHLASGRLIYREAGHNVWEHQDTQDIEKTVAGKRSLQCQFGQEYELEGGDEAEWCKTLCTAFCWEALRKAKLPSSSPRPLNILKRSLYDPGNCLEKGKEDKGHAHQHPRKP